MQLQLITLSGVKYDHQVYETTLPTVEGVIGVFPDHEPLVAVAKPGIVTVRAKKGDPDVSRQLFAISGGVIEITTGRIRVLVDEADEGDEIVEAEAKEALERAKKLQKEATNQVELDEAHALVDRQTVRLQLAELQRHHHHHESDEL